MKKLALVFATLMVLAPLSAFAQTQPDQNQAPTTSSASDVTQLLVGGN